VPFFVFAYEFSYPSNYAYCTPLRFVCYTHIMKEIFERKIPVRKRESSEKNTTGKPQKDAVFFHLNFFTIVWIFTLASLAGLILEEISHIIIYGEYESRAGLVWGPFSSIYGLAAVVLTLILNRFYKAHNVFIFLFCMVFGCFLEYMASLGLEYLAHAIAWDYTGTFGNINGRTNITFGICWGIIGLIWVRIVMPHLKYFSKEWSPTQKEKDAFKNPFKVAPEENYERSRFVTSHILTVLVSLFMVLNIGATCLALVRSGERAVDIPVNDPIDKVMDKLFPDEYMDKTFHNMTQTDDIESERYGPLKSIIPLNDPNFGK
ncbi:MAG: putative ABC transporter permease, partial [Anaerotardibacter sp.]